MEEVTDESGGSIVSTNRYKCKKLNRLGCKYHHLSPVGWYLGDIWIGYNAKQALEWMRALRPNK